MDPRKKEAAGSPGAQEGARRATERDPGEPGDGGRFSPQLKMEAVIRLLRGEDLDALSRELGVAGATLGEWREKFVAAGQSELRSPPDDEHDDEIRRLRAKIGEITMKNEPLRDRALATEAAHPFAPRRSRP